MKEIFLPTNTTEKGLFISTVISYAYKKTYRRQQLIIIEKSVSYLLALFSDVGNTIRKNGKL